MYAQQTSTIPIAEDPDLRATLQAFQDLQNQLSPVCYNDGKPLPALALHHAAYHDVKGTISAQVTASAIRLVAGTYHAAKSNTRSHPSVPVQATECLVPDQEARA